MQTPINSLEHYRSINPTRSSYRSSSSTVNRSENKVGDFLQRLLSQHTDVTLRGLLPYGTTYTKHLLVNTEDEDDPGMIQNLPHREVQKASGNHRCHFIRLLRPGIRCVRNVRQPGPRLCQPRRTMGVIIKAADPPAYAI